MEKLTLWDRSVHWVTVRGPAALRRRLRKWGGRFGYPSKAFTHSQADRKSLMVGREFDYGRPGPSNPEGGGGYLVKVGALEEIKKTLDANGCCKGLMFMPGQAKFCGKTFEVLKEVKWMYDERKWEMRKIRDVVILKGVICDGSDMYDKEGCDRSCYYYWKMDWLEKQP